MPIEQSGNCSEFANARHFLNNSELEFGKDLNNWVIQNVLFKVLFPAEFHGQSAVEAATELSDALST